MSRSCESGFRMACLVLISSLTLSGGASAVTLTEETKPEKPQAGYYRFRVGSVDVTTLSDGSLGFEVIEQLTNVKCSRLSDLQIELNCTDQRAEWSSRTRRRRFRQVTGRKPRLQVAALDLYDSLELQVLKISAVAGGVDDGLRDFQQP